MWEHHIWKPDEVKAFWDYESQFPENYWSRKYSRALVQKFQKVILSSKSIVDLGCGDGGLLEYLLPFLKRTSTKVYGLDSSSDSVDIVNKKFYSSPNFGGCFTDSQHLLEASSGEVDLIFCCEVIEHLYDHDLASVFDTARALINRSNGVIIITTPNDEDLSANLVFNPVSKTLFHRWQHVRSWNPSALREYLGLHGFNVKALETLNFRHYEPSGLLIKAYNRVRFRDQPNLIAIAAFNTF